MPKTGAKKKEVDIKTHPMSEKKEEADLQTFIENVNKKDKRSGLKIHFAFVNRKRKG